MLLFVIYTIYPLSQNTGFGPIMAYSYNYSKKRIRVATNRLSANYGLTFTGPGDSFTDSTKTAGLEVAALRTRSAVSG